MIINKIVTGFVIQSFDTDLQKFVEQTFVAGDQTDYEAEDGETIDEMDFEDLIGEQELPLDMVQPTDSL